MHTPYDADTYFAAHMPDNTGVAVVPSHTLKKGEQLLIAHRLASQGFEIVNERTGKEVCLDGSWAALARNPVALH